MQGVGSLLLMAWSSMWTAKHFSGPATPSPPSSPTPSMCASYEERRRKLGAPWSAVGRSVSPRGEGGGKSAEECNWALVKISSFRVWLWEQNRRLMRRECGVGRLGGNRGTTQMSRKTTGG